MFALRRLPSAAVHQQVPPYSQLLQQSTPLGQILSAGSSRNVSALATARGMKGFPRLPQICTQRHFASGGVEWHGTTILCVRKDGVTVMAGDGQVSMGSSVVKGNARKVRRLGDNILVGFAGSTADALTLLERLEKKLEEHPGQLTRACVELAKAWRTDKFLRRLEAVLLVADEKNIYEMTGNGDVLEPEQGVMGVGSGGSFALAAALALIDQPGVDAEAVARRAMKIAGDICVYTNHNVLLEKIEPKKSDEGGAGASAITSATLSTPVMGTGDAGSSGSSSTSSSIGDSSNMSNGSGGSEDISTDKRL